MAYQKKYKQGKVITSIEELSKQEFIYYREHIYHRGWFCVAKLLKSLFKGLEGKA